MAMTAQQIDAARQKMRTEGYSDDDINSAIEPYVAELERAYTPPADIAEPPPSNTPPELDEMRAAGGKKDQQRLMLEGALMGGGALVGGLAGGVVGRLIPAARNVGRIAKFGDYAARLAPELIGEYGGTYVGARASGMPPKQAARTSAAGAVIGLGARGLVEGGTRLAAKAGGVSPEAVGAGIDDPSLLTPPDRNAELDMARRLHAQLESQGAEITPYHRAYQKEFLGPVAERRIDVREYADILRSQIAGNPNPASKSADRVLQRMADDLVGNPGSTPESMGGAGPEMTLGELDSWIRNTLTDPLHGAYTKGSEAILNERLMAARSAMSERLYERLGAGATSVQKLASRRIGVREAVENTFPVGTNAKPSGAGAEKIRNIRSATGDAQKNREVLAAYDEEYGTHLLHDAEQLSMSREWTSDQLAIAYAIDSALQPSRPGFVRGIALPAARVGTRITSTVGPAAAATSAYRKRKRIPKAMESP